MEYREHGGGCCGRNHLLSFAYPEPTVEMVETAIRHKGRTCTEVVLTDNQISAHPDMLDVLEEVGFSLVYRFLNGNSGNYCNVFFHHPDGSDLEDVPFEYGSRIDGQRIPAPPSPAFVPFVMYLCVFRDGRLGRALYRTVRENNPRVRRYSASVILADGSEQRGRTIDV